MKSGGTKVPYAVDYSIVSTQTQARVLSECRPSRDNKYTQRCKTAEHSMPMSVDLPAQGQEL